MIVTIAFAIAGFTIMIALTIRTVRHLLKEDSEVKTSKKP